MNFEIYRILNLDYMEVNIIDLKTNIKAKITDCEQFKNINISHKLSVIYRDEDNINNYIYGTICSIEHEIYKNNESFDYKINIKVY